MTRAIGGSLKCPDRHDDPQPRVAPALSRRRCWPVNSCGRARRGSWRERGVGEWLHDQLDAGIEPAVMDDGVARVARREQDLELGAALARFVGELAAVERPGQTDIGEEQLDFALVAISVSAASPSAASTTR